METKSKNSKKKKKVLITLLVIFLVLGTLIGVFVYNMIVPKNLGVKVSKEAYESAIGKLKNDIDTDKEVLNVDAKLTSEEVTSLLGYNKSEESALDKVQVRVNADDSVDFSGVLHKEYLLDTMLGGAFSEESILESAPALKYLPNKLTVYFNFSGEVANNTTDISVNKISLMGISLPKSFYKKAEVQESINNALSNYLKAQADQNNGSYDMIKPENGELILKGQLPVSVVQKNSEQQG